MSDADDTSGRGVSRDARTRFAELLRRTERNGERIRLTRRGVPIAFIVPLSDGEKLRQYDGMARRGDDPGDLSDAPEFPTLGQFDPDSDSDPSYADEMNEPDHGTETERDIAIAAFKKSVMRIVTDTHELKRPDIRDKFKHDNYIGSAIRKVIGEGK